MQRPRSARGDESGGHPVNPTLYVEPTSLQVFTDPCGGVLLGEGELRMCMDVVGQADQAAPIPGDRRLSPLFERRAGALGCPRPEQGPPLQQRI
jgi:hypothetical protein